MRPSSIFPKASAVIAVLATSCAQLPGGLLASGQTLKGKISGSGLGSKTKIGIKMGTFLPSQMTSAEVVNVSSDGTWSYGLPAGKDQVTAFAFVDANGNGKFDTDETNSFESVKCPNCSYIVATLVGDSWKVAIKRSGTSSDADLASAHVQFDA
jgi:hypothetical protein